MKTAKKSPYAPTYHRDGTVTVWDAYQQSAVRTSRLTASQSQSQSTSDREKIEAHFQKAS